MNVPEVRHDNMASLYDPATVRNSNGDLIVKRHPRSKTISTTFSSLNPNSSHTKTNSRVLVRKSQDARLSSSSISLRPERSENLAKTLIARGSKLLRRQNSRSDSTSLRTWQWLEASQDDVGPYEGHSTKALRDLKHNRMHSTGNIPLRSQISQPYNFQHLTHTYANQLTKLDKASHSQLVSEFSAIRASQVPRRELKGIKADRLYGRSSSFEGLQSEPLSPSWSLSTTSPPLSPRSVQHHRFYSVQSRSGSLPYSRSSENFSQPSPKSYKSIPPAITPPPRISSKKSVPESFTFHESFKSSANKHLKANNDHLIPISPTTCTTLEWEENSIDYSTTPHAVSTPDESALTLIPATPGTIRTELDDVPEEDEVSRWRNNTAPKSPLASPGSGLRHSQSFPIVKAAPFRWSNPSPEASTCSPVSPVSEIPRWTESVIPLIDQPLDDIPLQPRLSRRISTGFSGSDCCWEDDIDYCYEHAAEADCEFDWDRLSQEDGETENMDQNCDIANGSNNSTKTKEDENIRTNAYHHESTTEIESSADPSSPFYVTPLETSTPGFEISQRNSAKSSTASLAGPITPSHSIVSPPRLDIPSHISKRSNLPDFSPSLFIPGDFETQLMHEEMYHRLFSGDHLPEQHYSFHEDSLDTTSTRDNSPRSSHLPSNSQESFFLPQSETSACRHRDSNSVSSLPELEYSKSIQIHEPASEGINGPAVSSISAASLGVQQPSQFVRPSRSQSQNLAKEVARQSVLQKLTISSPTLYQEKPLPSAPDLQNHFQEKPLPLTPASVA